MEFLPKKIENYAAKFTQNESEILSELNRETWAKVMTPRMLSGHMQGRILSMLSKMIQPTTIVEIGTYTGYSALCLAEGLSENGTLHTIDINEEYIAFADKYFQKSTYKNKIKQHIGIAIDILPEIKEKIQLVFIDADKENYSNYYNLVFDKLEVGGYIIADNVLWSGKVVEDEMDEETKALVDYSTLINEDKRVENVLLPVRDGLMICRKISE
ncbi:MAG: methyltransferase domain-containing protein [Flavobacteriales bacterium]|jgi:predicted O-methyltransferase YrrM|nr:methyltransferase domain-containing protein [Flavobacteriales bacterium]MBT6013444.1 methyltransferase domain-containing protein [Flavobacteriales bacterium]MBT7481032.1 methyltransferase domain-containing protein [Flavobacteriales bacterium]